MKNNWLKPILLVALLTVLVGSLKVATGWWRGELLLENEANWLWLAMLPVCLAVWWRYFSIFGCKEPQCLLPDEDGRSG